MSESMIPRRPEGIVALVTGAGSGIGRATALRLSAAGLRVAVLDLDGERADETVRLIRAQSGLAATYQGDVSSESEVETLTTAIRESQGPIGILVNVAGIQSPNCSIRELTLAEWQRVMGVNLTGTFLCSRAAIPDMVRLGWGRIVNTSSVLGKRGRAGTGAYATSKAALLGFTRSLALELVDKGVTANAVLPSMVDTNLVRAHMSAEQIQARGRELNVGRVAEAEEVAAAIEFLVSPGASYVNGAELVISGGTFMVA